MDKYTTVSGDTWDMIAYRIFRNERFARELVEFNLDHVAVVIFSGGVILNIPVIIQEEENILLPPWKRGVINAST